MLDLIGVPFDLCGRSRGSALGPVAMRIAGLHEALTDLRLEWRDLGDLETEPDPEPITQDGLRNFAGAVSSYELVKQTVRDSILSGNVPVVMAGDHSNSIGSISGALEATNGELSVLWIDAHADLNTPESSPSGNLHGMPVAALLGLPANSDGILGAQWRHLIECVIPMTRLKRDHIAWLGLRAVDHGERMIISTLSGCFATTMQDIDRHRVDRVVDAFVHWMKARKGQKLWISFDVDVLDPVFAGGTGTAVMGGLSYREGHFLAELLHQAAMTHDIELVGLDVVEVNPLLDANNMTAKFAVEWLCSLFGKQILEGHDRVQF
ncbi:MAG: arginase [Chthonomonas sp.]|nr:arginase [Chthonomonas sp.]